jgi:hypothetical protein
MSSQMNHSVVPIRLSSGWGVLKESQLSIFQNLAGLIFLPANLSAMISPGRLHPESEAGTASGRF